MAHGRGCPLAGLLHHIMAASNRTAEGYRGGVRCKDLYRVAVHRTGVYQSRFAGYIIRSVHGSHKAGRTNRQHANPHARAPHDHNGAAQTGCFEVVLDDPSKRRDGAPAIHVAICGVGRQDRRGMAFHVPPYTWQSGLQDLASKTTLRDRHEIYVTYDKTIPDREPTIQACASITR